jgi:hypothetical protein
MRLFSITLAVLLAAMSVVAEPVTVTVRAVSRDAKVIGDGVGGARITIREVDSGTVLATGIQSGGTGDTKRIMQEPRGRNAIVYGTEGAAAFRATLDLMRPTRVEIVAEGPLKYPQAMQRVSRTMLLVPGQNIGGEGVLLEIPGFIVDILSPATVTHGEEWKLRVKVTMTCGCPTEPGGLWNADHIAITARLAGAPKAVIEGTLKYAGEPSTYELTMPPLAPGTWDVEVVAVDRVTENAGRATQRVVMAP